MRRRRALPRAAVSALCLLCAAVWLYEGILGETTVFGRTALWARAGDALFGLVLLAGAVIWAVRAVRCRRQEGGGRPSAGGD